MEKISIEFTETEISEMLEYFNRKRKGNQEIVTVLQESNEGVANDNQWQRKVAFFDKWINKFEFAL